MSVIEYGSRPFIVYIYDVTYTSFILLDKPLNYKASKTPSWVIVWVVGCPVKLSGSR